MANSTRWMELEQGRKGVYVLLPDTTEEFLRGLIDFDPSPTYQALAALGASREFLSLFEPRKTNGTLPIE